MRPLSIEWRDLLLAAAIFVAIILVFAFLSSAAGWPNATSGWPIAIGIALVLALLRVIGPVLDYLRQTGAKLETPFLKLDWAGAARATVITQQPWVLSDDLIRRSSSVPDSAIGELERSAQSFSGQPEIVLDLEDGGAWYTTRVFAVAATAAVVGSPQAIVLIGQRNAVPRQFGGWISPHDVVTAFLRRDHKFAQVYSHAIEYLSQLRMHAGDTSFAAPVSLPKFTQYKYPFQTYGDTAVIRILVDQMQYPDPAPPAPSAEALELPQQPPWINLEELERLLQPWLVRDHVEVDQAPKEQVIKILASPHQFIASTRGGQFIGMIDVRRVERDIVRQLVARAPE
jgi:hypothetical protein